MVIDSSFTLSNLENFKFKIIMGVGKMNIYLVRHGKDYAEYLGGWSDLGLIEEGIHQYIIISTFQYMTQMLVSHLISKHFIKLRLLIV